MSLPAKQKPDRDKWSGRCRWSRALEGLCTWIANAITYVLMLVINEGHSFEDIKNARLLKDKELEGVINCCLSADFALKQSIEYKNIEVDRKATIDDKNKVLLTICALLFAADAAILSNVDPKWLALIPLVPITAAVYLVLMAFQVEKAYVPDYEAICFGSHQDDDHAKLEIAQENLESGYRLHSANDYRVGVHRAAWRLIPLAILLLLVVLICGVLGRSSEDTFLKGLKNNQKIRNELRGPAGTQGPPGPEGPRGPTGPPGPQGPPAPLVPEGLPHCQHKDLVDSRVLTDNPLGYARNRDI